MAGNLKQPSNEIVFPHHHDTRQSRRKGQVSSKQETDMGTEEIVAAVEKRLKGMAVSIEKFSELSTDSVTEWLDDFELLAEDNGRTTDKDKARFLSFHLAGEAKTLYHDLEPAEKAKFTAIKAKLIEQFSPSSTDLQTAKMAFYNRKQGPYESLVDFIKIAQQQSRHLGMSQEDIVAVVVNNSRPAVRRALRPHKFKTLREMAKSQVAQDDFEDDFNHPALQAIMTKLDAVQLAQERQQKVHFAAAADTSQRQSRQPDRQSNSNNYRSSSRSQSRGRYDPKHKDSCGRCGTVGCKSDYKCYARDKVCHRCDKKGHLKPLCKTKLNK